MPQATAPVHLRSRSPELSPLRPIASGQHPSVVAKHDQLPGILLDTVSVDRSGDLEVGVPIEDLLDALTARLEKLDRVSCNVGWHWPDFVCMGVSSRMGLMSMATYLLPLGVQFPVGSWPANCLTNACRFGSSLQQRLCDLRAIARVLPTGQSASPSSKRHSSRDLLRVTAKPGEQWCSI